MAMTGGTAVLLFTGAYDGEPSIPINFYAYYKVTQDAATNTSSVLLGAYVTVPAGYPIGPWADDGGSYICGQSFDGTVPGGTEGTYWLAENLPYTVQHAGNGSGVLSIGWRWGVKSDMAGILAPSGTVSVTLPTINRLATSSLAAGTLGVAQTINVTRPVPSLVVKVYYQAPGISKTLIGTVAGSTLSWTPPVSLSAAVPAGTAVSVTLLTETYDTDGIELQGMTLAASTQQVPSSVVPTASLTLSDSQGLPAIYGAYVQGKSDLQIAVTGTGAQGSSIVSYSVSVVQGGVTLWAYSSDSITTPVLPASGTVTVTATVTDTRGRTGTATQTVTVLAYAVPTVTSLIARRSDAYGTEASDGDHAKVTWSAEIADLNNGNSAAYRVLYRLEGTSVWTELAVPAEDGNYTPTGIVTIFPAAVTDVYEIAVRTVDDFGSADSSIVRVGIAAVLMQTTPDFSGLDIGGPGTAPVNDELNVYLRAVFHSSLKVAAPTYDTETITPSIGTAVADECWVKRALGLVQLNLALNVQTSLVEPMAVVASLPLGYRPAGTIYVPVSMDYKNLIRVAKVDSSGDVWLHIDDGGVPSLVTVIITGTFFAG